MSEDFYLWGVEVAQGYGLTETAPVLTAENRKKFRFGSIGLPMVNVELKIENPDENGVGEIVATGPNVMLEYYILTCIYSDNWENIKENKYEFYEYDN